MLKKPEMLESKKKQQPSRAVLPSSRLSSPYEDFTLILQSLAARGIFGGQKENQTMSSYIYYIK